MVYVIAEAGSNHVGEPGLARELVAAAAGAGCDAVKFQAFEWEDVWEDGRKRGAPFAPEWFEVAVAEADTRGLDFFCTPFDVRWVPILEPYVARWKVSASHIGDTALLDACHATGKDIMVSTAFLRPEAIFGYLWRWGALPLHCVHAYPASFHAYAIDEFCHRGGLQRWGISDHAPGFGASLCAVAKGASVVEKHIKLRNQPKSADDGPHALTPTELKSFVVLLGEVAEARDGDLGAPVRRPGMKVWLPEDGGW